MHDTTLKAHPNLSPFLQIQLTIK